MEAASIKVVGAKTSLKSILRAVGSPRRRRGLKVGFQLPNREEEEEEKEGASNKRIARSRSPLPTQRSE